MEITSKSGLCKNLYLNTYPHLKVDHWFPRAYDLSQTGQIDELIEDYYKTSIQNIIQRHYQFFKSLNKGIITKAYRDY